MTGIEERRRGVIDETALEAATDAIIESENTSIKMLRFRARGYAKAAIQAYLAESSHLGERGTRKSGGVHRWSTEPNTRTTPVKCLLCDSEAAVIVYAPHGCTCSPNKIQPRCEQHLRRADDTGEEYTIIEDFRIPIKP